jgi:hypothetical protein
MEHFKSPQECVITAFKDRNIPYKRDDIESAFNNASGDCSVNTKWVSDHLGYETLLSKEETAL